jgi:hypothetical protein
LVSFYLLLFFSYGHVFSGAADLKAPGNSAAFRLALLGMAIWVAALAAATWGAFRIRWRPDIAVLFWVMSAAASVRPVFLIATHELRLRQAEPPAQVDGCALDPVTALRAPTLPDVYFVVLDGYGRADILQDDFGYDNSDFLGFLEDRGFYIADQSHSNYIQTRLSLAATLNMDYLDPEGLRDELELTLAKRIRSSSLRASLENLGYRIVSFGTGYPTTEIPDAEAYLVAPGAPGSVVGLEPVVLGRRMLGWLGEANPFLGHPFYRQDLGAQRLRIDFALDQLAEQVPSMPGPKFVFAHVIAPHPPFVFRADGSVPDPLLPVSPDDGSSFPGTLADYLRGYTDQLSYLNERLRRVVEGILAGSEAQPIIILQADHGPGSRLNWSSAEESDLEERTGILNALYLPGAGAESLYPTLSPVNTFRLVLSEYFGSDCRPLPDLSYFSNWAAPTDFVPVRHRQGN